jgi:hypothetical protein
MRKILPFEISVAIKDRPKTFQFITLALFSFCITVILIASFQRMVSEEQQPVVKGSSSVPYTGMVSSASLQGLKR